VVGLTGRFKPVPDKRGVYAQPGSAILATAPVPTNVIRFSAPTAAVAGARR